MTEPIKMEDLWKFQALYYISVTTKDLQEKEDCEIVIKNLEQTLDLKEVNRIKLQVLNSVSMNQRLHNERFNYEKILKERF